jgi:hypothetical protein
MRRGSRAFAGLGVLASAGIMVAALTGSSSAAQATSEQSEPTTSTPSSETTPARTATATTLPEVGTYTVVAKNTKFVSEIRLGSLQYGQAGAPPSEVLSACPAEEVGSTGNAAFAQGEVLYTYAEGSVPFQVTVNGKGAMMGVTLEGTGGIADLVLKTTQGWMCSGYEAVNFTFQPHETVSVPFWAVNGYVLTNTRSRLSQSELNRVALNLKPFGAWEHEQSTSITVSGPQAVTCEGEQGEQRYKLLPYAQLNQGSGCHKGGGTFTDGE